MKSKTQKRKEALQRRERDLSAWRHTPTAAVMHSRAVTENTANKILGEKVSRAEADILNLKAKLGVAV